MVLFGSWRKATALFVGSTVQRRQGAAGVSIAPRARCCVRFLAIATLLLLDLAPANARTVQLRGNVSRAISSLHLTRPAAANKPLEITIFFALRNQAELDQLLAGQQDPNSPQYHRWLTPDEFAARFGPTETDFHAVTDWLHSEGLNMELADIKSREIRYADTVSHGEQMFRVHILSTDDGRLFGNREEPSLPERFDGVIAFIDGLDNLRAVVPASHPALTRNQSDAARELQSPVPLQVAGLLSAGIWTTGRTEPDFQGGNGIGFGPADLHTFYDETPLLDAGIDGRGSDCIAFIEGSDFPDSAVSQFDQLFSLPDPVLTRVFPGTKSPGEKSSFLEFEATLDVEWAHAAAPGVALKVYIVNPSKPAAAADAGQRVLKDNSCGVVSVSLIPCGLPESSFPGVVGAQEAQAASQGMSVFVASGDFGAAGLGIDKTRTRCVPEKIRVVNELSASPNVTSVGGTQANPTFDSSGNDVGFVPELVWNDFTGASGGGKSGAYRKPAYQRGLTPNDNARDVPDAAALAAHEPGFYVSFFPEGRVECCGVGTSFSAPIWAGFATLIAQLAGGRLGNINPRLYRLGPLEDKSSVGLRDVTSGNNTFNGVKGFDAGPLYDQATGWGSPDVAIFAKAFLAIPTPTPTRTPIPQSTPRRTPIPRSPPTRTPRVLEP